MADTSNAPKGSDKQPPNEETTEEESSDDGFMKTRPTVVAGGLQFGTTFIPTPAFTPNCPCPGTPAANPMVAGMIEGSKACLTLVDDYQRIQNQKHGQFILDVSHKWMAFIVFGAFLWHGLRIVGDWIIS